jgi:predicted ribosomally synthesized peptide with nif11-like leader
MSKENVALFIKAVNTKTDLNMKIAKASKTSEWVMLAKDAGFEFTAEEFALVVSNITQKKVTPDNAVHEYMAANNAFAKGELGQKALDAVTGGMLSRVVCRPHFVRV